jgi:hypothetical protein
MSSRPMLIEEDNLSRAWVRAVEALMQPGANALAPLVVTVRLPGDGQIPLVQSIGNYIDAALTAGGVPSSRTTANLIFPSFWNPARPRSELFERYRRMLPRIRRAPLNHDGVYFERLIAFGENGAERNQLEYIISTYAAGNHRRSALQASILDPRADQTNQRQRGFPCLQQVSFTPDRKLGLTVTGYYATQYLVDRGYGNYVGLCRLGQFVAHELGQECTRMTCVAAVARLGDRWTKTWTRGHLGPLHQLLADAEATVADGVELGGTST